MFENDEWNIDEDYLNDFNDGVVTEDLENQKINNKTNKPNTEITGKPTNTPQFEFDYSIFENDKSKNETKCIDTISRKNAVLDIFNNTNNVKPSTSIKNSSIQNSEQSRILAPNTANEYRKNLVLDVFQNNENSEIKNNPAKSKPVIKSVLRIPEETFENNRLKRKKNVAFSESINDATCVKKVCVSTINEVSSKKQESFLIQDGKQPSTSFALTTINNENLENFSNKQMALDLFKYPAQKIIKAVRTKAPQAVIRKFPGPAGLLPDDINESEIIDLDSEDDNKNNKINKFNDVCSQNTKNLFTTGAWQLMMDDLPANFELFDIATVKENALEYSRAYKKVPYLAGIIQYIDYKPNDPQVILKDLTGRIDARIHHSICKLYPNALGTQIVILVKDVGLIVTSKKYVCLIISMKNLVSIYSDDTRLVETPNLEKLLDNNYNCNLNESQISILDENIEKNQKQNADIASESSTKVLKNNSIKSKTKSVPNEKSIVIKMQENELNNKQQTKTVDKIDDVHDFDFGEDDSWLGVNLDEINSFNCHQFPSSTPMDANNIDLVPMGTKKINNDFEKSKILDSTGKKNIAPLTIKKNNEILDASKPLLPIKDFENNSKFLDENKNDSDDEILSQLDVDAIAASYSR